ncbi:MAG: hypothetical protein ACF788_11710 [Novipirellula sp. JB048]
MFKLMHLCCCLALSIPPSASPLQATHPNVGDIATPITEGGGVSLSQTLPGNAFSIEPPAIASLMDTAQKPSYPTNATLRILVDDGASISINGYRTSTQRFSYGSRLFTLAGLSPSTPTPVLLEVKQCDGSVVLKSFMAESGKSYREDFRTFFTTAIAPVDDTSGGNQEVEPDDSSASSEASPSRELPPPPPPADEAAPPNQAPAEDTSESLAPNTEARRLFELDVTPDKNSKKGLTAQLNYDEDEKLAIRSITFDGAFLPSTLDLIETTMWPTDMLQPGDLTADGVLTLQLYMTKLDGTEFSLEAFPVDNTYTIPVKFSVDTPRTAKIKFAAEITTADPHTKNVKTWIEETIAAVKDSPTKMYRSDDILSLTVIGYLTHGSLKDFPVGSKLEIRIFH